MDEKEKKDISKFGFDNLNYIPMYGDLILWKQTIDKAKGTNTNSIIFITDDTKEDWIYYINSNGKKDIGVRAELRQEIQKKSKVNIFEVYNSSKFMQLGKDNLELSEINDNSINEAKENTEAKRKHNLADAIKGVNTSGAIIINKDDLQKYLHFNLDEMYEKKDYLEKNLATFNYLSNKFTASEEYDLADFYLTRSEGITRELKLLAHAIEVKKMEL